MRHRIATIVGYDLRVTARDGEQLLLVLVVPVLFLLFFSQVPVFDDDDPIGRLTPAMMALGIVGSAFTRTAISVGFDRAFGALARYAVSPLRRREFLLAKGLATGLVVLIQLAVIGVLGAVLGWRPDASIAAAGIVVAAVIALFTAGIVLASVAEGLRSLGLANLIFVVVLLTCGAIAPLDELPAWLAAGARLLAPTAVVAGLDAALSGSSVEGWVWLNLAAWCAVGTAAALRLFRWR